MNILITAGGTKERIDSVRSITNHATGTLGSKIADAFAARPEVSHIVYLCGENAVRPNTKLAEIHPIFGTRELEDSLKQLTQKYTFDAVIHSMAVSDYRVRSVTTESAIAQAVQNAETEEEITTALRQTQSLEQDGKISSTKDDLVIMLEQTPKIIGMLRTLIPNAVIVGFKLLDGVSTKELIDTAHRLLVKNDCDYVFANDLQSVESAKHCGYLVDAEAKAEPYDGKEQIASGIAAVVCERLKK
ncbi:MAG: phosphopantothenoylcysteine decarboxylase [Evtepia sp.]